MRVRPPWDWSQCPECGVPIAHLEVVDAGTPAAGIISDPCGHPFPLELP